MSNIDDFDQFCSWAIKPHAFMDHQERNEDSDVREIKDNECDDIHDDLMLYRVRSFKRTHKGVVNQGDKVKSCSFLSLNLPQRSNSFTKGEKPFIFQYNEKQSLSSPDEPTSSNIKPQVRTKEYPSSTNDNKKTTFEIYVTGRNGVGKTSLCEQFSTSDSFELSINSGSCGQNIQKVTVDLDDIEWTLNFHDFDYSEQKSNNENLPDAYILVYSIDDNDSFDWCSEKVATLSESAIFIVGNKSDLERLRQVSMDKGKRLAEIYDGQFFEVSTILNHMVDNLLVQIIMEIRRHSKQLNQKGKCFKSSYFRNHKKSSPGDTLLNFFRRLSKAF